MQLRPALLLLIAASLAATAPPRVAHIIVALADNQYQGIVPVPAAIGNGDDPVRNLYWGAGYGLKTFLPKSPDWRLLRPCQPAQYPILERCIFESREKNAYAVADAYRGREIKRAITDFFTFAAGNATEQIRITDSLTIPAAGSADLIAYIGHDGLMDFSLDHYHYSNGKTHKPVIIIACASKNYFADSLRWTGAQPLLWTTGLLAPEAYVIEAALAGWLRHESGPPIRARAATAYDKYQHCGIKAATGLFATGW